MSALELSSQTQPAPAVPQEPFLSRLTLRNMLGLYRYVKFRVSYPQLRVGLFFVDRGYNIRFGPDAQVRFGVGVRFMRDCNIDFHRQVTIGNNVYFNRGCSIMSHRSLTIGDNCLFGEYVSIHDEDHVIGLGPEPISTRGFVSAPIVIGKNVWVGAKATILKNVTIGDNAVVAAHAVVTRDVPAGTIVGGIPARVIRAI